MRCTRTLIASGVLCVFAMLHFRPTYGETIHHGDAAPSCGPLPDGVTPISGLVAGFIAREGDSVRLSLSSALAQCGEDLAGKVGERAVACEKAWAISLLLPPELLLPGKYTLKEHSVQVQFITGNVEAGSGCSDRCANSVMSGGNAPNVPLEGMDGRPDPVLEIYSVSDTCITGRLAHLDSGQRFPPPPNYDGGFGVVPCASQ